MHLRFESALAGGNFSYQPGDVCDWPDEAEAARLVERGIAQELSQEDAEKIAASGGRPVRRHRRPETATRKGGEKAVA